MLGEVSFVALGADDNTTANVAAAAIKEDDMTFDQWLAAKGFDPASLNDTQKASLQAMFDAATQEPKPGVVTATATDDDPGSGGDTDVVARIRAETAAENGSALVKSGASVRWREAGTPTSKPKPSPRAGT